MDTENNTSRITEMEQIPAAQKAWRFIRTCNSLHSTDLNRIAITDGTAEYTYGMMFRQWERYASVFSALGMTAGQHARVGLMGSIGAEVSFAAYGLNMVGAEVSVVAGYKAMKPGAMLQVIRDEHLTDFILTDDFAQPPLLNILLGKKEELGLRNILLLHLPVGGSTADPMLSAAQEAKYLYVKSWYAPICMETLLEVYKDHPVCYADDESTDAAFILHTSGTTSGTGKPIPMSDQAVNQVCTAFSRLEEISDMSNEAVSSVIVDLSNAYSMFDQVHAPLSLGGKIVFVPGGAMNPLLYRAISDHRMTFLFAISPMIEQWMKLPETTLFDFSSLQFVVLGGSSVSAKDKKRYLAFFRKYGGNDIKLINGYGISELGGACVLSTPDPDDESIGYPMEGVELRLITEDEQVLGIENAPCEGILYLTSASAATTMLDGREVVESKEIDGKPFICTNDQVRVESDGKITFLGRANRYFLNDKGKRYDAGRVETELARHSGIGSCAVAPFYSKVLHDNLPMLCVTIAEGEEAPQDVILHALRKVFLQDKTLPEDQLPCRVLLARELPRNHNGKIDLYKIGRGEVEGEIYELNPVRALGTLQDLSLVKFQDKGSGDMLKEVFREIAGDLKEDLTGQGKPKEQRAALSAADPAVGFRAMNEVGRQFLQLAQKHPGCINLPNMQQMAQNMMPNMQQMAQNMMPNMQQMAQNMMPNMQQMMRNCAQFWQPGAGQGMTGGKG